MLTWHRVPREGGRRGRRRVILDGVSCVAHPGHILGVAGPSGAGKSMLLDALGGRIHRKSLQGFASSTSDYLVDICTQLISVSTDQPTKMGSAEELHTSATTTAADEPPPDLSDLSPILCKLSLLISLREEAALSCERFKIQMEKSLALHRCSLPKAPPHWDMPAQYADPTRRSRHRRAVVEASSEYDGAIQYY